MKRIHDCSDVEVLDESNKPPAKRFSMFTIRHTFDSWEEDPPIETLSDLYDELASAEQEHGDVSVTHEDSGWCMSAHRGGLLVFCNLGDESLEGRHMVRVPKAQVIEHWKRLISGDIDGLLSEPWRPGYS